MRRLLCCLLFLCSPLGAVDLVSDLPSCTASDMWEVWLAFESSDTDCTDDLTNAGSTIAKCCCLNGSVYSCKGTTGGGSSNSFETINAPSGTDPVADSSTDTLNLTAGTGITITGDSSTDTITIAGAPAITLDLGDDGGNDSTALSEIATIRDDYGVVTEPSADKALIDFALVPPYRQYDPLRPRTNYGTGGVGDEFTGGCTLSRTTGNADSSSISCTRDGLLLDGDDSRDEWTVEWFDPPGSNADFTVTAIIHAAYQTQTSGSGCGLAILDGGTVGSPTNIVYFYNAFNTTATSAILLQDETDYAAAGASNIWNIFPSTGSLLGQKGYFQLRYIDSTRVVTATYAQDGQVFSFPDTETTTLANDPIKVGLASRQGAECFMEFIRMPTGSDRNNASD